MPRRRRWQNVRGTRSRVTGSRDRVMVVAANAAALLVSPFVLGKVTGNAPSPPDDILVLRLDRIGDMLMTLPALNALRDAHPRARIRLAVGEWSRDIAHDAPVDEVLIWSAPWAGRPDEGASTARDLFARARSLRNNPPDLAIDFQGDVRAIWLMAATGARERIGYANTGSAALLTRVAELDENVNFVEQNYRAVETAVGVEVPRKPFTWLDEERRARGRARLNAETDRAGAQPNRPVIGLHPGAGRRIKEWPIERFVEVARHLAEQKGATLLLTGSKGEKQKTETIHAMLPHSTVDVAGKWSLGELAEVMSACDAFISGDTAAMHFACAIGVPSVAIFGPSDPGRYFSGGPLGFGSGAKHIALAPQLWCSPCNLIRRPPEECAALPAPECLTNVTVDAVLAATLDVLR